MAIKGYWKLNGNANDYSGNGYNGNATNITYSQANGRLNEGAGFNGSSSYILGNTDLGITGGSITLSAWFKINSQPSNESIYCIIAQSDAGVDVEYYIRYYNKVGTYQVDFIRGRRGVLTNEINVIKTLIIDKWYYFTLTYDGSNIRGYIDSVFSGTMTSSGNGSSGSSDSWSLGRILGFSTWYADGSIDEAIIDNTVWSQAKIKNEYSRIKGFF